MGASWCEYVPFAPHQMAGWAATCAKAVPLSIVPSMFAVIKRLAELDLLSDFIWFQPHGEPPSHEYQTAENPQDFMLESKRIDPGPIKAYLYLTQSSHTLHDLCFYVAWRFSLIARSIA